MYDIHSRNEFGAGYIPGINPSIAKLVHALVCWGAETIESHASFYPGDEEEQEYWVQKKGIEDSIGTCISGPIVLSGVVHAFPYVRMHLMKNKTNQLKKLLIKGWDLEEEHEIFKNEQFLRIKLEYSSDRYLSFKQEIDEFWEPYLEIYSDEEWYDFLKQANIPELNAQFHQAMPLSPEEYIKERDKAINELAKVLYQDIANQDKFEIKERIDRYLLVTDSFSD